MSGLTIAAIPKADDPVWKTSSEKVPHLTILYLGEQKRSEVLGNIIGYVGHAAAISLHRFTLEVDRRGVLGDDDADVLFFAKYSTKEVARFRSFLLKNDRIAEAYNSVEQYPAWTPHLTLGYPETPAKKDPDNTREIHWVDFDRIAVWTDDYDGPEFVLGRWDDEASAAMSDRSYAVLEHHGIKGMRWGVRRSEAQLAENSSSGSSHDPSDDAERVRATAQKIREHGGNTDAISNSDLQAYVTRMNLEQQYGRLSQEASNVQQGQKRVKEILSIAKTAQEVYIFMHGPLGKAIRNSIMKR